MGALQNLEKGKVLTALKDIVNSVEAEFTSLETEFPALATFVSQFDTDIGKAVLTEGAVDIAAVQSGALSILAAAEKFVETAWNDTMSISKADALTIAANGIGVLVRAASVPAA